MDGKGISFQYNFDITKTYEEEGNWIVEGLCATSDLDLQGDIITQRALELSAKDLEEYSTVLHNHNEDEAIGKVIRSESVQDGLWLKVFISKTAPEIWQKIKEGVLNKFSIRGKVLEAKKKWVDKLQKFIKFILRMKLVEASIVAVPANVKAKTLRWYIEKALDEFEKNGGELKIMDGKEFEQLVEKKETPENSQDTNPELNSGEENTPVIEEELLEASGEPELENKDESQDSSKQDEKEKSSAETEEVKGFPAPEILWEEWTGYCKEQKVSEQSAWDGWINFCKQKGYPYPYPYPYAKPRIAVNNLQELISLLDELIEDEEDPEILDGLKEIKSILNQIVGRQYPYPYPKPNRKTEQSVDKSGKEKELQNGERKNSVKRMLELKKLAESLQGLITELGKEEEPKKVEQKNVSQEKPKEEFEKKFKQIEENIEKAFGSLMDTLLKRIENLEKVAGKSQVIKGQEDEEGGTEKGSVWKGVIRPLYEK